MEVRNNYYTLTPKGLLFTSQELKISGCFLNSKDGASLLAQQGLVTPSLATGSGPMKGCGAPVATEGSGGSSWAAGSVLLFAQLGSAWSHPVVHPGHRESQFPAQELSSHLGCRSHEEGSQD